MINIVLFVTLLVILVVWSFGFLFTHDFSVQTKNINDISSKNPNVLIIFPHADDEALSSGGLISQLSRKKNKISWIILTKGERGNATATIDEKLKIIRINEARQAAQIYGINNLVQKDYPDNEVVAYKNKLNNDLKSMITENKPSLIITYDLAGLYGHPDHTVVSEVVTKLVKHDFPHTKLWYVSYPKKILDLIPLPEHMATDNKFKKNRSYPSCKVWVGLSGVLDKMRAIYTYKSQRQSFVNSFPIKIFPLWLYISLSSYEYYCEVNQSNNKL